MNRSWLLILALLLPLATGCGQKASTRTTAVTPAPVESGPLQAQGQNTAIARSPSELHCGSQAPVWVNERTKIYHLQGDPYYGRTKLGGYLCERDAVHAGYRPSKTGGGKY